MIFKDRAYSLASVKRLLAKQWHPTKNGLLFPKDVLPFSNKKVWWVCNKGHEWEAVINKRSNGRNCPYCSNKIVCFDNCLKTINPEISKQWHPTKNGKLTPLKVTPGVAKKIWWLCEKNHSWLATIRDRIRGYRCPFCSGRRVLPKKSLSYKNRRISKEWHPVKNGTITPENVLPYSHLKIWWLCKKGHEWKTAVGNRSKGTNCPECYMIFRKKKKLEKYKTSQSLN